MCYFTVDRQSNSLMIIIQSQRLEENLKQNQYRVISRAPISRLKKLQMKNMIKMKNIMASEQKTETLITFNDYRSYSQIKSPVSRLSIKLSIIITTVITIIYFLVYFGESLEVLGNKIVINPWRQGYVYLSLLCNSIINESNQWSEIYSFRVIY